MTAPIACWVASLTCRKGKGRLGIVGEAGGGYRPAAAGEREQLYGFFGGIRIPLIRIARLWKYCPLYLQQPVYDEVLEYLKRQCEAAGFDARYMSGGQISVPIVIRAQQGGGRGNGAQHSQSFESWMAQVPGLSPREPLGA